MPLFVTKKKLDTPIYLQDKVFEYRYVKIIPDWVSLSLVSLGVAVMFAAMYFAESGNVALSAVSFVVSLLCIAPSVENLVTYSEEEYQKKMSR